MTKPHDLMSDFHYVNSHIAAVIIDYCEIYTASIDANKIALVMRKVLRIFDISPALK